MTDHTKEVATLRQALRRAEKLAEERLHQLQQEQGAHSHLRREAEQKVGGCQQLRHQGGQGLDRQHACGKPAPAGQPMLTAVFSRFSLTMDMGIQPCWAHPWWGF